MCDYECDNLFKYDENFKKELENFILHWNYRNLKFFPEILKYNGKHIEDLYLKGNFIRNVPNWINELENLSEIHLADNTIQEIPEEISNLSALTVLDIYNNQITRLPKSLTSLTRLNCFNASKNLLKKLPDDIGRLKELSQLYVSYNNISYIPSSITGCVSLREIDLDYNKLTSIPKSMVDMPNLEIISVRRNEIVYLPTIPFRSKPWLLASKNKNLTHISYDVESLRQNDEWLRVYLDESMDESEKMNRNFNGSQNETSNYSIIYTEKCSLLVIPMQVHHENDTAVPFLYEISFREIDKMNLTNNNQSTTLKNELLGQLPRCIVTEFDNGPTARCQKCNTGLFKFAFIRILWDEKRPKLNIVQYFCSKMCLKLFKNEITTCFWPEIQWNHKNSVQT